MLKSGRLYILDFQDARMGVPHYDLASILYDSYVKLEDSARRELMNYYIDRRNLSAGKPLDRNAFQAMLLRAGLQRNLKALGTFGYQAVEKGNEFYIQFVPDTVGYIRENLPKLDELKEDADWIISLITGKH
jgi:hypothetical protein